jgi:hypothetical protein
VYDRSKEQCGGITDYDYDMADAEGKMQEWLKGWE